MCMKNYLIYICLLISQFGMAQNKAEKAILETLSQQIKAWNEGDTKKFMIGYWESDSLMFIGKSGITFSHRETLARYQKNYPDKATMGTLKFDILRMKPLGRKNYFVVGKWHFRNGSYYTGRSTFFTHLVE